jgi:hypothetical protein
LEWKLLWRWWLKPLCWKLGCLGVVVEAQSHHLHPKSSEEIEADKNKDATVTTAFHMYQNQITLLILMQPRIAKTLGSLLFKEVFSFTFFKAISTMSV